MNFRQKNKIGDEVVSEAYGPGSYAVQPGSAIHSEINSGPGELVALVYFDGPVDFVLDV